MLFPTAKNRRSTQTTTNQKPDLEDLSCLHLPAAYKSTDLNTQILSPEFSITSNVLDTGDLHFKSNENKCSFRFPP